MVEGKYGKHFITDCTKPRPEVWGPVASGPFDMYKVKEVFPESNIAGSGVYITKPFVMVDTTHIHDFDEYLFFFGTNFENMNDFDAEVELYMGAEGEKHVIKSPTIVCVPANLIHCPLKFVAINKPILFFHTRHAA